MFEPVRLAVKAKVPCLRELELLDLVLLVLDFEEDIMIGIVVIGRNEHEKKRGEWKWEWEEVPSIHLTYRP